MSKTNIRMIEMVIKADKVWLDGLKKKLDKEIESKKKEIHSIFKNYISPAITRAQSDEGFSGSDLGLTSRQPRKSASFLSELNKIFEQAWRKQYDEYIRRHRALPRKIPYEKTAWAKYKKENVGKRPGPWFAPSLPIRYTTHTLATGYLRENIAKAFKSRGNSLLKIDKSLAQIAWQFDISASPDNYEEWFLEVSKKFQSSGVSPGAEGVVDFSDIDWQVISGLVATSLRDNPVEEIIDILKNFNLSV